jgi:hypothetical protein
MLSSIQFGLPFIASRACMFLICSYMACSVVACSVPAAAEGEGDSPLGPLADAAQDAGYPGGQVGGKPILCEGYYFRILTAQWPNGDSGAKSYSQSGRMTGGFALIAWPARFETSGIMTFIVGPDGDVYQKNLGPNTARVVAELKAFDPDSSWKRVTEAND